MLKIIVLRFFSLCQSSKACYIVLINIFLYYLTSQVVRVVKNLPANAGDAKDVGSIPGWGWSPGVGNSNPLWYYCLENSIDRGTWWATVHGVTKNQTRLSMRAESSSLQTVSSAVAWDRGGSRLPTFTLSPTALLVYVLYNGLQPARLLCPWDFPGKNSGVGCHFLLPGIFPTQGSNPGLPHWQILY